MGRSSNLTGVVAMLAGTGSFVVGDSFMKVVTSDLPPFEVLFLRGVAASLACGLCLSCSASGASSPRPCILGHCCGRPERR